MDSTSLSGEPAVQEPHTAFDSGPIVGMSLVLFAWVSSWGVTLEHLDKVFVLVTHGCFCVVAVFGAWKTIAPAATTAWQRMRGR